MKAPPFTYHAPATLDEALALLAERPDDTSLLAGGQSLMPLLHLRMARPEAIVDLNGVGELASVQRTNGVLRLGAMVRQRRLERDSEIAAVAPLLKEAAGHVAHLAIRTRGTVGGSLAHADPSAELPAAMAALDATLELRRAGGATRALPARSFVLGPLTTAVEPGEMLVAIDVPVPPPGSGWCFTEVARTHGAFALAGAAAVVSLDDGGRIAHVALALCGVGGEPYVPDWLEQMLGETPEGELFAGVGARVRGEVAPFSDGHASERYRRRVAGVLAERALTTAAQRARGNDEVTGARE